jgi:type VI secretion system secreted protein Hcp
MTFQEYTNGAFLPAESQVDFSGNSEELFTSPTPLKQGCVFEIEDFSFDVEQTLNIGSQSSGSGAGKITFNPFSITRKIDKASTRFFEMACSGTAFQQVTLALRKSIGTGGGGAGVSGMIFLRFDFKLVAVKTISWSHDDESPKEEVTFEYGGLQIRYAQQAASGKLMPSIIGGWNRVKNVKDQGTTMIT